MDDKTDHEIDYRALYEETQSRLHQEQKDREDAERRLHQEQQDREDAERRLEETQKQVRNTTFFEFLNICHHSIFMTFKVERNKLLSTTGRLTRVDGKLYPRYLKPWSDFSARSEVSFAALEQAFQQQPPLLPSPAGLGYVANKLSDKRLASEEDLKNFECLAVEGCVLDVMPRFLELVQRGAATIPNVDALAVDALSAVSFNNYPFGVVAGESDEATSGADSDQDGTLPVATTPSRGRARGRGRSHSRGGKNNKPLRIKGDRPAYIGALGVARRDMDMAIERAAAEADERDRSGPPRKRPSSERTSVHPDQWCFRHSNDGTMRPLFVIEYKAAHKIDEGFLRKSLEPDAAASLMEEVVRALPKTGAVKAARDNKDDDLMAKRDIAKVFAQTYHYMVDYGLQYSYATTGYALIFFYLDPAQPSTLYYHLEEPKQTVHSTDRESIKQSAVALVLAFMLTAMTGQYMTHRWKKTVFRGQPKWPNLYDSMQGPLGDTTDKRDNNDKEDQDDEGAGDPGPSSRPRRSARKPTSSTTTEAHAASTGQASSTTTTTSTTRTRQASTATPTSVLAATTSGSKETPVWSVPVNAPLSPSLPYCTQACLLGLKTGGAKDLRCPNVSLHKHRDAAGTANGAKDERHPISLKTFRALLVRQLADDMDHDFHSLERFGMYGAIGALFKIALSAYGYCFVGKGVQRMHRKRLANEATAYHFLEACQGRLVPVNLGVIELVDEYWTECGAHISHMMLMAFAGESLWHHGRRADSPVRDYQDEIERTLCELEPYGVLHDDINNNNMTWNDELQRVMAIDFDHARITAAVQPRWQEEREPANELRKRRDMPGHHSSHSLELKRTKIDC